jgi:hypothetical protein
MTGIARMIPTVIATWSWIMNGSVRPSAIG